MNKPSLSMYPQVSPRLKNETSSFNTKRYLITSYSPFNSRACLAKLDPCTNGHKQYKRRSMVLSTPTLQQASQTGRGY